MSFESVFRLVLSDKQQFSKILSVDKLICELGEQKFVNIRSFWRKEENKLIPTKSGICLRPEEFREIIDSLKDRKPFKLIRHQRIIEFKKSSRPFLFELTLIKEEWSEEGSKEGALQKLVLIDTEIKKLIESKESIFEKI